MSDSPIKLVSVKCPECGAALTVEDGRQQAFCSYCGTRVLIANENEKITRTINEAEIKKAEAERDIRLKELENENQKQKNNKKIIAFLWAGIFVLAVLSLIFVIIRY